MSKDGGPAFPTHYASSVTKDEGMSLRDYFAAHADIPWQAVMETMKLLGIEKPTVAELLNYRAGLKYIEADAMLEARIKSEASDG